MEIAMGREEFYLHGIGHANVRRHHCVLSRQTLNLS